MVRIEFTFVTFSGIAYRSDRAAGIEGVVTPDTLDPTSTVSLCDGGSGVGFVNNLFLGILFLGDFFLDDLFLNGHLLNRLLLNSFFLGGLVLSRFVLSRLVLRRLVLSRLVPHGSLLGWRVLVFFLGRHVCCLASPFFLICELAMCA